MIIFNQINIYKTIGDKGKPAETRGRKATGPSKDGSQLPKNSFFIYEIRNSPDELSSDKGKPAETRGRKATGPSKDGSQLPKGEFSVKGKSSIFFVVFVFVFISAGILRTEASDIFDISQSEKGIVCVNYPPGGKKMKIMVKKDKTNYYYDLKHDSEVLPLQMGSGEYTFALMENVSGNKYAMKTKETVNVNLIDEKMPFLQSATPVKWDKHMEAVKLVEELTKNIDGDEKKAYAIYEYIVKNIKYDRDKLKALSSDYVPSVDRVLADKKGICYDFAALLAAMLRSQDIPAKLVKGYKNDIDSYHAWNEVYLKRTGWVIIDTTYDSIMAQNGTSTGFIKDSKDYKKIHEY